jgi:hypothetical protein
LNPECNTAIFEKVYSNEVTDMARARTTAAAGTRRRRKTLDVDQRLLDRARAALAASTETEAVRRALERVVDNRRVADGILMMAGKNWVDRRRIDE